MSDNIVAASVAAGKNSMVIDIMRKATGENNIDKAYLAMFTMGSGALYENAITHGISRNAIGKTMTGLTRDAGATTESLHHYLGQSVTTSDNFKSEKNAMIAQAEYVRDHPQGQLAEDMEYSKTILQITDSSSKDVKHGYDSAAAMTQVLPGMLSNTNSAFHSTATTVVSKAMELKKLTSMPSFNTTEELVSYENNLAWTRGKALHETFGKLMGKVASRTDEMGMKVDMYIPTETKDQLDWMYNAAGASGNEAPGVVSKKLNELWEEGAGEPTIRKNLQAKGTTAAQINAIVQEVKASAAQEPELSKFNTLIAKAVTLDQLPKIKANFSKAFSEVLAHKDDHSTTEVELAKWATTAQTIDGEQRAPIDDARLWVKRSGELLEQKAYKKAALGGIDAFMQAGVSGVADVVRDHTGLGNAYIKMDEAERLGRIQNQVSKILTNAGVTGENREAGMQQAMASLQLDSSKQMYDLFLHTMVPTVNGFAMQVVQGKISAKYDRSDKGGGAREFTS